MKVVRVRMEDDQVKRIDLLVKHGIYKSRNQAIRELLKARRKEELSEDEDVEDLVKVLIESKNRGHEPLVLRLEKNAVETGAGKEIRYWWANDADYPYYLYVDENRRSMTASTRLDG